MSVTPPDGLWHADSIWWSRSANTTGAKFWILTSEGRKLLGDFSEMSAKSKGWPPGLESFLEREPVFKEFLVALAKGE